MQVHRVPQSIGRYNLQEKISNQFKEDTWWRNGSAYRAGAPSNFKAAEMKVWKCQFLCKFSVSYVFPCINTRGLS